MTEAKHEKKDTSFCGGGYLKLLGADLDQKNFGGDSPYAGLCEAHGLSAKALYKSNRAGYGRTSPRSVAV